MKSAELPLMFGALGFRQCNASVVQSTLYVLRAYDDWNRERRWRQKI